VILIRGDGVALLLVVFCVSRRWCSLANSFFLRNVVMAPQRVALLDEIDEGFEVMRP
jgi:hypothetical protein